MTEVEWRTCTQPAALLDFLLKSGKLTERKGRLFGIAVCRDQWLPGREDAIEMTLRYADEKTRAGEASLETIEWLSETVTPTWGGDTARQTALLRDIFGSPFRPVTISPAILAWSDGLVVRLAQAVYDERPLPDGSLNPNRIAVLADALEEGSCSDADILSHLRGPGPHVRGCVIVDAVLGKPCGSAGFHPCLSLIGSSTIVLHEQSKRSGCSKHQQRRIPRWQKRKQRLRHRRTARALSRR
jgi:hypothetical protein